jgi:hypothetical protein
MGTRKLRDTSYSLTQRLIKKLGIEEVEKTWQKLGIYKAADELSKRMDDEFISPYVLRYMSNKYDWKREANKYSPIYKAVLAGTRPAAYYKHLIFQKEIIKNEKSI